jgi:hypothetical protein
VQVAVEDKGNIVGSTVEMRAEDWSNQWREIMWKAQTTQGKSYKKRHNLEAILPYMRVIQLCSAPN